MSGELEALSDAASPGKWVVHEDVIDAPSANFRYYVAAFDGHPAGAVQWDADAAFIVALVNAYRAGELYTRADAGGEDKTDLLTKAVVILASRGIDPDVQGLLLQGNPQRGIAPGALAAVIAALRPTADAGDPTINQGEVK